MRNLSVIDRKSSECSLFTTCTAAAIERNILYFANQNDLCKLEVDKANAEENVEVLVPLNDEVVLDVKYLPEEDILALVAKSGSISIFDLNSSMFEVVGDVAGGVDACCWSPDMETLVIVSGLGSVLMMTRMWDVLQEAPLFQSDFGEAKFVTVGWGSKETQFHGSEGKNARSKKDVQSTLASWDDKRARIVWRADGLFFAINAVDPNAGHRVIRVFDREGNLQSTSEAISQLEQSLSWRSSGASGLITSTISLVQQGRQQVAFYEKNGLRHGEFEIESGHKVLDSYWNGDSTVLALLVEFSEEGDYGIQLWTMSNYHWYMKHLIPFVTGTRPVWISWDVIETNRLHVISSNGAYTSLDYRFMVNASTSLSQDDPGCIAVIDNKRIKVTFLREAVIPPPMCGWEIQFPKAILAVDFNNCNQLLVVTHDGLVHFFNLVSDSENTVKLPSGMEIIRKEGRNLRPVWTATIKLDLPNYALLYQWRWVNPSTLVACLANRLVVLELGESTISIKETLELESRVCALVISRDRNSLVLAHLINGKTLQVLTDDLKSTEFSSCTECCNQVDLVNNHLIGLSSSGRLYVDGREILSSISSMALHSHFLLVIRMQKHQLLCIPLSQLDGSTPTANVEERAVERGTRLVHAVSGSTAVVLQMPRGNLEAIHPRPLSLNVIKLMIDRRCYLEAFEMMKKQRINLNLLCDHNPQEFISGCDGFVKQISLKDVANLNLFLGELQNDDFTLTMYQSYYESKSSTPLEAKVNTICIQLRKVMDDIDPKKYLLPILTSLIKQGELDSALKRVQILDDESIKDQALKYMAVLVDGDQLYKKALATYDLQLTLMVAHRSQKDPKEYLAFLNELNTMADEHERRFTIDNSLKRYDSAVRNLCRCRPFRTEQVVGFMKLHRIFSPVVDELSCNVPLLDDSKEALQTAARFQAETLSARENHEEAGYLYQRVQLYNEALSSFQQCGLWSNCLALASLLQLSDSEVADLVKKLVVRLQTLKNYADAAHLAEYHLKDYQLSGQCLVDGFYFSEAWALAGRHNLIDWKESVLAKELEEAFQSMHIKLEQVEGECCQHVQRLLIVRRDLLHKMQNPPAEMMTDHGDLYSETGSSFFTHSTGTGTSSKRSSKNKRKHERKKLRLKEGSPFEDLAIIHELYVLYNSINGVLGDVGRVLRGDLLISKDWNRAKTLQSKGESLVKLMEEKKKEIWNFSTINSRSQEPDKNYGPAATTEMVISQINKEKEDYFATRYMELDVKLRIAPDSPDNSWKLDALK